MSKQYGERVTLLLFARQDDETIDWACTSHAHDRGVCNMRRLCDYCWLEHEISEGGASMILGDNPEPDENTVLRIVGRLWSEKYESIDGTDYDAGFEIDSIHALKQETTHAKR